MNDHPNQRSKPGRREEAFTMVEIALCLAVIGFALVSIIGVLPTGLQVQKENREETIINQDGALLLEALRSGAKGLDYLTNHFRFISIKSNGQLTIDQTITRFRNGREVIGLLGWPAVLSNNRGRYDRVHVQARVRAITGGLSLKGETEADKDFDLNYLLTCEIYPANIFPPEFTDVSTANLQKTNTVYWLQSNNISNNFFEVSMKFEWPVFQEGGAAVEDVRVGNQSKVFRALVSGRRLMEINPDNEQMYFINAGNFTQVHTNANGQLVNYGNDPNNP